jgi:hypothetical protein
VTALGTAVTTSAASAAVAASAGAALTVGQWLRRGLAGSVAGLLWGS